jgi:epoxide hydrolase-like predicted phosphatase
VKRNGLLVDYGGVLTTSVFACFAAFCTAEGLPADAVTTLFRADPAARELLTGLEVGTLPAAEFDARLGRLLGVGPDRLGRRLFAGVAPDPVMRRAVRAARRQGVRTALVSNSWGDGGYDRHEFDDLFDAVVISGELGVRKPSPEIYRYALDAVGLPGGRCVFVDDLPGNLSPARDLGMATVVHRDAGTTVPVLEDLFGLSLR